MSSNAMAPSRDASLAHAAYGAALNREHVAAGAYARLARSAWQLTLTTAGMVAVVNSVVVEAVAGLALADAGVDPLGLPLAFAAVVGAGTLSLHQRHHRRGCDAYTPELVDRAAIFVSSSPQADTA